MLRRFELGDGVGKGSGRRCELGVLLVLLVLCLRLLLHRSCRVLMLMVVRRRERARCGRYTSLSLCAVLTFAVLLVIYLSKAVVDLNNCRSMLQRR